MVVGHDDDKNVLRGLVKILGHLVGRGHRLRRQRLNRLVLDDLRQRGKGYEQNDDQGDPMREMIQPGSADHGAAQQRRSRRSSSLFLVVAFFNIVVASVFQFVSAGIAEITDVVPAVGALVRTTQHKRRFPRLLRVVLDAYGALRSPRKRVSY